MTDLTNENAGLREKEKSWRRQMRDLEGELAGYKERARYAQEKNIEYERKLDGANREVFRLGTEVEKESIYRTL